MTERERFTKGKKFGEEKQKLFLGDRHTPKQFSTLSQKDIQELAEGRTVKMAGNFMVTSEQYQKFLKAKARYDNFPKYAPEQMMVYRTRVQRYVNEHGLYMSKHIPDVLNRLNFELLDRAMTRVWLEKKRFTVMPRDIF